MTLPFISYGGSSLISLASGMGMLIALTRERPQARLSGETCLPPARRRNAAGGPGAGPGRGWRNRRPFVSGRRRGSADQPRHQRSSCDRPPGGAIRRRLCRGHGSRIASATLRGRGPVAMARTASALALGVTQAWGLIGRLRPAAVVGFGGYPTVPPVLSAAWRGVPTIIHDANAVLGRANRFLAPRVTAIATTFPDVVKDQPALGAKVTLTGNPLRPAVLAAAATPYPSCYRIFAPPHFGGSQGARVMANVVPAAIGVLEPTLRARLAIVQQSREEDLQRVRAAYGELSVSVEVAPFFTDLPARMASAHLVVARSGAGTVAELSAIGRPAILVPLPHALDQDQFANAGVLERVGGAIRLPQKEFTPRRLADEIVALAAAPQRLQHMAAAAHS